MTTNKSLFRRVLYTFAVLLLFAVPAALATANVWWVVQDTSKKSDSVAVMDIVCVVLVLICYYALILCWLVWKFRGRSGSVQIDTVSSPKDKGKKEGGDRP